MWRRWGKSGGGEAIDTSTASGEVSYWLWDANQLPAYQACADKFTEANPNVTVKITQLGWDDYWAKLTNGFIAGDAPDVFTNHLAKYLEYVSQEAARRPGRDAGQGWLKVDQYTKGLPELWVGQDGKRYGLPKDWDTIGIFYNKKGRRRSRASAEQMANLQWNPRTAAATKR